MKTAEYIEKNISTGFPLSRIADPARTIFLDIETTGLSPRDASIYMIGIGVLRQNDLHIKQLFADEPSEERSVIESYLSFAAGYETIITFNGNRFDIPFLEKRAAVYGIDPGLSDKTGIDIYKRLRPFRTLLSLSDMKQKSLEIFLGINREDEMSGKDLTGIYDRYTKGRDPEKLKLMLLHNHDDVLGLTQLLPLLAYPLVVTGPIKAERAVKNNYNDYNGNICTELIIEFTYETPVPVPVSGGFADCYLMLGGNKGKLRVAIFEGTMKFFYPDHKNYYYLPDEDRAIHKSAARYVDKGHREQAVPETCYVKVKGQFLPEWEPVVSPSFRNEYREKTMYFELSDEIKNDPEVFRRYAGHLMNTILKEL